MKTSGPHPLAVLIASCISKWLHSRYVLFRAMHNGLNDWIDCLTSPQKYNAGIVCELPCVFHCTEITSKWFINDLTFPHTSHHRTPPHPQSRLIIYYNNVLINFFQLYWLMTHLLWAVNHIRVWVSVLYFLASSAITSLMLLMKHFMCVVGRLSFTLYLLDQFSKSRNHPEWFGELDFCREYMNGSF